MNIRTNICILFILVLLLRAKGYVTYQDIKGRYLPVKVVGSNCGSLLEITSSGPTIKAEEYVLDGNTPCIGAFQNEMHTPEDIIEKAAVKTTVRYLNWYGGNVEFQCGGTKLVLFQIFETRDGSFVGDSKQESYPYEKGFVYLTVRFWSGGRCYYIKQDPNNIPAIPESTTPSATPSVTPVLSESSTSIGTSDEGGSISGETEDPPSSSSETISQNETERNTEQDGTSRWVWIGAILSFLGAVSAALITAFCGRGSN